LVAVILAAVSVAPVQAQRPDNDTLVVATTETLNNDPAIGANASSLRVIMNVYEGLVRFEYGGLKLEPALAERWRVSPNGRVFTFFLRPNVRFHDGSILTADDVKYSFNRVKAKNSGNAYIVAEYKEARVIDARTIQIELTEPSAPFLQMIPRLFIVSRRCVERNAGDDMGTRYLQDNSCGTGPFRIQSWERARQLTLAWFNQYWRGWPQKHLNRVVIRALLEVATTRLLLERGDIDVAQFISLDDLARAATNPNLQVVSAPGIPAIYLQMVMHKGPTRDVRVRQALSLSFPYEAYLRDVMRGQARPLTGPLARGITCQDTALPAPRQDLARAKELLTQAGYGQGMKINLIGNPGFEERRQMALLWQSELRKIGVDLEFREMDQGPWYTLMRRGDGSETFIFGNFPAYPDPDGYFWRFFHSSQVGDVGFNLSFFQSREVDDLLEQGRTTLNARQRCEAYARVQRIMVDQYVAIWVMQQNVTEIHRSRVKNYRPPPHSYQVMEFYPMYKEGP
jgi:peptide/nickel transport system substrate-binding protein